MKLRIACAVGTVVVFGLSLRLLFGSTSALTSDIAEFYSANSTSMALLTTGPVICLGVFAATARYFVRRVPVTHVLVVCLFLVAVGTAVRAVPSWPILVVGTLVAAAGIAVANVLGPVFVRLVVREWSLSERPRGREWSLSERPRGREWSSTGEPDAAAGRRLGLLTGVLTAVISASAGVASGVSVPLAEAFDGGWRIVLGLWSIPVVLAAGSMAVFGRTLSRGLSVAGSATVPDDAPRSRTGVLTSPVAWSLTAFMGLQSLMAYSMIAWLPTIFRDRGVDARDAGLLLTALSVSSVLTALTVPSLATRLGNQSALAVAVTLPTCVGLLGIVSSADSWALVWAVLLGLGQGGQLSLAMTLMNLRASNARDAASLSSMAQTVGYVLAAAGPLVCGAVHSATQRWESSIVFLLLVTIPMAAAGAVAGRRVVVGSEAEPADAVRGS
ncbi:MFS transporter [Rhodococcus fascians]|nr:MFS transporter [Rhodococcus fascians]MBY3995916.1 MFS transporter [Rhodococcus fascians]MBY4001574.1 MFS transporter [Rhodococcus fascians]MBY4006078.1 MFS transporter [Rhodococcus fascians]MBY4017347.1 MFS transporter [Rhodococcus fascians]